MKSKDDYDLNDIKLGTHLGSGGFGSVYECYMAGKRYALKRFHISSRNEKAAQESFQSEQMATKLQHRYIVRTFCTFIKQQTRFILMEFVSTQTLQSVINDESQTLDLKRRNKFARHITSGLAYAHKKNIVHLDLKPQNILVTKGTDECKIADFGCCKNLTECNSPTTPTKSNLTGTYSYRAPELLRGEPATEKADIYSFGICLWQMVARERPYGGENHQIIIFKVVAYNLRPKIPDNTEKLYTQVMTRCWDKCKAKRQTAQEVNLFLARNF